MKKLTLLAYILFSLNAGAQQVQLSYASSSSNSTANAVPPPCLSDILMAQKRAADPAYQQRIDNMNLNVLSMINGSQVQQSVQSVLSVPVVIHIIHNNGPENISNAQALQGLQDLNDAYANSGPYTNANGVNVGIQFCLAQQDESGAPTTGITRNVSSLTNETAEVDDINLKNIIRWDPTKYLNIWVVNSITSQAMGPGVAGYAYLPSSHGNPEDGIVIEAAWFGSATDNSKVLVHEAGHYLGLYHTFEGGCTNTNCQTDGDMVCDTPPDNSTAAVNCLSSVNSCTTDDDDLSVNNPFRPVANGGMGDQDDMIENYMDYGFQSCQVFFTSGQKDRMVAALTTTRSSLLSSIGCQTLCPNPISIGFNMSASVILAGGTVNCTNTTTPSSTYSWEVNGVPQSSSTNFSYVFNTPGTYTITLIATNGNSTCDESLDQIVTVNCQAQASFTMSPAGPYNPGATITFTNTSTGSTNYQWMLDGISQGSTTNYSNTFNTAGGHYVYLIADNGSCSDTSVFSFFDIGVCSQTHMSDHWVVDGVSIDFSSGSPVTGTSPMPAGTGIECTSSISDANGNLQFSTDGITVWDRNNNVMSNGTGLMGHHSASQGVLITPMPGNTHQYYIFTTGAVENSYSSGFRYSIVDMTLNAGLGAVTATKNILLLSTIGEKSTATWASNHTDIWVCTHSATGNTFYSFLITPSGINTVPVTTVMGANIDIGIGSMTFSHDGLHVAIDIMTNGPPRYVIYAQFDRTTGVFSNPMTIMSTVSWEQPMTLEFSPDNSKLYGAGWNATRVYQWDLSLGTQAAIAASQTIVDTYGSTGSWGRIKLAPNGIIYICGMTWQFMDAILYPNLAGTACGYTTGVISTPGSNAGYALPNLLQGLDQPVSATISGPAVVCSGTTTTYYVLNGSPSDSAVWTHIGGGTLTTTTDTSAELLSGSTAGVDTLILTNYCACGITRDTIVTQTVVATTASLGNDTALCGSILLSPGSGFNSYLWQNSSTAGTFTASSTGTYWVEVTDANNCVSRDSIIISANPNLPPVDLGPDVTVCLGHTAVLNAGNSYSNYNWQDGTHNQTFTAFWPGTYWVTVTGACYSGTDTIRVIGDESGIALDLGNDTAICSNGFPYVLNAPAGAYTYLWDDNSTAATYSVSAPGQYYVTVTDQGGCSARDTIAITNCVDVGDHFADNEWMIYPNPANESFTITVNRNDAYTISLYNTSGQLVLNRMIDDRTNTVEIETGDLAEGLYMIEIYSGNTISSRKVLIKH